MQNATFDRLTCEEILIRLIISPFRSWVFIVRQGSFRRQFPVTLVMDMVSVAVREKSEVLMQTTLRKCQNEAEVLKLNFEELLRYSYPAMYLEINTKTCYPLQLSFSVCGESCGKGWWTHSHIVL